MKKIIRLFKLIYILWLLSFNTSVVAGTIIDIGKITGKITDKATGLPIPGATVSIPDLNIGTSADSNGIYLFQQLPKGEYLIQVTAVGYASVTKVIDLGNTHSADFKLSASNYELADVAVTALGNTTTIQRAPIPISVVTHNTILQGVYNTAIDEIASQPGVNETTEGAGTTKPQINGLGFDRVLTLMDGLPNVIKLRNKCLIISNLLCFIGLFFVYLVHTQLVNMQKKPHISS